MTTTDDPKPDLHVVLAQGRALIDRRRYGMARGILSSALSAYPEHPELLYLLAFVDYSEKRFASAEQTVSSVLVNAPKHYGARTLAAALCEEGRRFAEAERIWIDLLQDYPEDADCYAGYADLMLRTLHLEKAWRLVQEGLRLEPEHSRCLFTACLLQVIQGRSLSKEGEHLQQLLQQHPEKTSSLMTLIIALEQRGENRAALRVAEQLLTMHPDSPHFVELVRVLRRNTHWSMLPLYPMLRWGWGGAIALTLGGMIGLRVLSHTVPLDVANTVAYVWLAYCLYSWVWPSLLKRFI